MPNSIQSVTAELASLRHLTVAQLRERYCALFGKPSRTNNKKFLRKRVGYRIQELAEGTPPDSAEDLSFEEELASTAKIRWKTQPKTVEVQTSISDPDRDPRLPPVGTRLTKLFRGENHVVTVLQSSFEYRGNTYPNLSKLATQIAGSRWNGFVFFGLGKKEEPR